MKNFLKRWGWGLPIAVIAILTLFASSLLPTPPAADKNIRIEASMFQFSPGEIQVNPGDRVTVELVSTDVVHGLSLDGYDFELKGEPGQTVTGSFVADKSGVFRFRCSVACGNLHPFMIGKLQVGPNLLLIRAIVLSLIAVIAAVLSIKLASKPELRPGL